MIIVDGNMLAHRAFHKMDFLKNSAGVHTGLEFGFLRSLEMLARKFPEHRMIICFDTARNKKRESCERYKANRSTMKSVFYERLAELQKFVNCIWDMAWQEGEEADDVMHSIAILRATEMKTKCIGLEDIYLYSNDNDLLQCVTDKIFVLKSHESNLYIWDENKIEDKYGLPPELLVLFRSFVGDSSDNLDGVPRIQKKILVEAILAATLDKGFTDVKEIALYISGITSWSISMNIKIQEFIDSGLWRENYDLMKLEICDYQYFTAEMNKDFMLKKLREWEIGSLDMCKEFASELVDPESEF